MLSELPTALLSEVLSHLDAAELAVAIQTSRMLRDASRDAASTRCRALKLPAPPASEQWRASVLLRMSETRATHQALCKSAVGFSHQLFIAGQTLYSSGVDPETARRRNSSVLGHQPDDDEPLGEENEDTDPFIISPVRALAAIQVVEVAAGVVHSLALTESGAVYSMGRNSFGQLGEVMTAESIDGRGPKRVDGLPGACQRVSAGAHFSFVLTAHGALYAFGSNHYGELGLECVRKNVDTPTLVDQSAGFAPHFDASRPLQQAAGGRSHALFLGLSGAVLWACGRNDHGQLGDPFMTRPAAAGWRWVQVNFLGADVRPGRITHVACGQNHSLCVKGGAVYAWGCNDGGQCGERGGAASTMPRRERLPGQLGQPGHYDANAVACAIETWYDDKTYGPPTTDLAHDAFALRQLRTPSSSAESPSMIRVAAGVYHSLALTADGQALRIGNGGHLPNPRRNGPNGHVPEPRFSGSVAQIAAGGRTSVVLYGSSSVTFAKAPENDGDGYLRAAMSIPVGGVMGLRRTCCAELRHPTANATSSSSFARVPYFTRFEVVACDNARTGVSGEV